jgi:hypothetical protein
VTGGELDGRGDCIVVKLVHCAVNLVEVWCVVGERGRVAREREKGVMEVRREGAW